MYIKCLFQFSGFQQKHSSHDPVHLIGKKATSALVNHFMRSGYLKVYVHCKKRLTVFPSPAGFTYQTLPGREKLNYSRPGRVW
jgi:hypothetical protein